jgi:hypothetical protein
MISAPPVRTMFAEEKDQTGSGISLPWLKWMQSLVGAVNGSPQTVTAPVHANSTGTTGQIAYDANFAYFCVAPNAWRRTALVAW